MILDLTIIVAAVVFVVDISGFSATLLRVVNYALRNSGVQLTRLKPFTCSLCMSWWCGIAYGLATGLPFLTTLAIGVGCGLAALPMKDILTALLDLLAAVVRAIDKLTNRI